MDFPNFGIHESQLYMESAPSETFIFHLSLGRTGSQIQLHHLQLGGRPQVKISYLLPKHDYEVHMDRSCANTH